MSASIEGRSAVTPAAPAGERLVAPARITMALDARDLFGPAVDLACDTWEGNPAGDVDAWEEGRAVPTPGQVEALARLTNMPVEYFYEPVEPHVMGPVFICDRSRGKNGLTRVTSWVDGRGVLRYGHEGGGA